MNNTDKLNIVFNNINEISEMVNELMPRESFFNDNDLFNVYSNKLYSEINESFCLLKESLESLGLSFLADTIEPFYEEIYAKLNNINNTYHSSMDFYNEKLNNLDNNTINNCKNNFGCYYLMSSLSRLENIIENDINSINELLFTLKFYLINDESIYRSIGITNIKYTKDNNIINIRGKSKEDITEIFRDVPYFGEANIVYLNKRILILLNGLGHAMTINIEKNGKCYFVEYFVPEISKDENYDNLRGIYNYNEKDKKAYGKILSTKNDLIKDINNIVKEIANKDRIIKLRREKNLEKI